jgi:hypothetical protein
MRHATATASCHCTASIHGNYFCDECEVGCECEQALASQLTPKIASAVVVSFN